MSKRKCWWCHGSQFEEWEDYRVASVQVGPKTVMEAKTVRDGFLVPMCVDCQKEFRIAIGTLGQMLLARRSELEK